MDSFRRAGEVENEASREVVAVGRKGRNVSVAVAVICRCRHVLYNLLELFALYLIEVRLIFRSASRVDMVQGLFFTQKASCMRWTECSILYAIMVSQKSKPGRHRRGRCKKRMDLKLGEKVSINGQPVITQARAQWLLSKPTPAKLPCNSIRCLEIGA